MIRTAIMLAALLTTSCSNGVYVRDGVTDGDRFHVSEQALLDQDPVVQSWSAYSLTKSVCQLEIGGDNPARANSFGCEFSSRLALLDTWDKMREENPNLQDAYLNTLADVRDAGFLDEYVVYYFGKRAWNVPAELERDDFGQWRRRYLRGHRPVTRIVGSWTYRSE